MKTYAGIDLHSSNSFLGVIDEQDTRLYSKRLPNDLETILSALKPFQDSLKSVVIESTYNWYWLVDGLMTAGYPVNLANPSAIKQYEGLKNTDDKWDSFWLAHMKRLGILPEGYIYPKEERPIRDLLRRRMLFVQQRTTQILSFQTMVSCVKGFKLKASQIKKLTEKEIKEIFDSDYMVLIAQEQISTIRTLNESIKRIEQKVKSEITLKKEFEMLLTIPGIGVILALTIMLEVGDIKRFEKVGNFTSYCRCVSSQRTSNNKPKGKRNTKNGNKYLAWAFVEAANFSKRFSLQSQKYYQRKAAKTKNVVAIKALSHKLARASYYVMRDKVPYEADSLFR